MRTAIIICEYNPFHSGHARLISEARRDGCERVVCIMSGNFVQRGEPAASDAYTRAKAACLGGADLVLELPLRYACGSAEFFALGGVMTAKALGISGELWFGSECGNTEKLSEIAERQMTSEFAECAAELHRKNTGFAEAQSEAYDKIYGKEESLCRPNDILAVEYLKALRRCGSALVPRTIKRCGSYLSEKVSPGEAFASSTALRALIYDGKTDEIARFMPEKSFKALTDGAKQGLFPTDMKKYRNILFSFARLADAAEISRFDGADGGLAAYIVSAARSSCCADDFFASLPTKKYTDSRLRRTLLASVLRITRDDRRKAPEYVRLLAANSRGREALAEIKRGGGLPVISRQSELSALISASRAEKREDITAMCDMDFRADSLFGMCLPLPKDAGFFARGTPFVEE
ncbi:MAG: nucleotidyltransferase family protein [Eubacteriales bacterium]